MEDTLVIDTLKTCFEMEISNKFTIKRNKITVILADGTKASITTKNVA